MNFIIAAVFLFGVVIGVLLDRIRTAGTLRIDHSNPDKDVYRFEINDLDSLNKKKHIVLTIDHHADLSQR